MPMPDLDPSRFVAAVLSDPTHKLPLPDKGGRLFLAAGETVDSWDPFYSHLLGDGSLRLKPAEIAAEPAAVPETPAPATAAETASAVDLSPTAAPPAAEPPVATPAAPQAASEPPAPDAPAVH